MPRVETKTNRSKFMKACKSCLFGVHNKATRTEYASYTCKFKFDKEDIDKLVRAKAPYHVAGLIISIHPVNIRLNLLPDKCPGWKPIPKPPQMPIYCPKK